MTSFFIRYSRRKLKSYGKIKKTRRGRAHKFGEVVLAQVQYKDAFEIKKDGI